MPSRPDNTVEQSNAERIDRYEKDDLVKVIYEALPEDRKERFIEYRRMWHKVDKERTDIPFPLNIYIEPVSNCNLKCVFCVRSREKWHEEVPGIFSNARLGYETFAKLMDEGEQHGLPAIWVGASGEALLEKDIPEMMKYADSKGVLDTILITNGTMLDKETVDKLLETPITRITISIDAITEETYKKVRGGNYKKLISNIEYLLEKRKELNSMLPIVRLSFVDMDLNHHEREQFVDYWIDKVDTIDVQKYWDFDLYAPIEDKERDIRCSFGWRSVMILGNGDVAPCCSFYGMRDLVMGNINEQSLKSIWDSDKFMTFREDMIAGRYAEACKACFDSSS
ncbi:radical SAM/SPASM domain-containing protein [Salidesulfovibrio brasiliensis]|uniref:radical SAM/SPASM domain-containing protein n=1 Tax=Salidesulfovibrio brasiliensis TaxID=221711 RepID=UPI0006D238E6|nr:radical SAM protein [Salidesulfovibrio brasiliensis]